MDGWPPASKWEASQATRSPLLPSSPRASEGRAWREAWFALALGLVGHCIASLSSVTSTSQGVCGRAWLNPGRGLPRLTKPLPPLHHLLTPSSPFFFPTHPTHNQNRERWCASPRSARPFARARSARSTLSTRSRSTRPARPPTTRRYVDMLDRGGRGGRVGGEEKLRL